MFKKLKKFIRKKKFDLLLARGSKIKSCHLLITWNRGLGDIPLGLYPLIHQIREKIPSCRITLLTRTDLAEASRMLPNVEVKEMPSWKRGEKISLRILKASLGSIDQYHLILHQPDVSLLVKESIGKVIPRLSWKEAFNALADKFHLNPEDKFIGVHVHSETNYAYEKNWGERQWAELFRRLEESTPYKIILIGGNKSPDYKGKNIIDLRGETTLFEVVSLIKNKCLFFIGPDSGILNVIYYLDEVFPLKVISLWADPMQGLLKQGVSSPNGSLKHKALVGVHKQINKIPVEEVLKLIRQDDLWIADETMHFF